MSMLISFTFSRTVSFVCCFCFFSFDILLLGVDDQPISLGCENTQKTSEILVFFDLLCFFWTEIMFYLKLLLS